MLAILALVSTQHQSASCQVLSRAQVHEVTLYHPCQRHQSSSSPCVLAEPKILPLTKRERQQITALLASLDLPQELTSALMTSAEQQLIPRDAAALGTQLKALLLHSTSAAKLLPAATSAASALGLTLPQMLGIAAAAPLLINMPVEEMQSRVDKLATAVNVSKAAAAQLVARNAALLAVPPEALAAKLDLVARTVGMAPLQATKMVTVYMFPGVRLA